MSLLTHPTDVFILRIWREPRERVDAPPAWRGVVEHVPTGDRRYFLTLEQAMIIILEMVGQHEEC